MIRKILVVCCLFLNAPLAFAQSNQPFTAFVNSSPLAANPLGPDSNISVTQSGVSKRIPGPNAMDYFGATRGVTAVPPLTGGGTLSNNIAIGVNTFSSGGAGVVPASGGGSTNFLGADGTWKVPAGTGMPLTGAGAVLPTAPNNLGLNGCPHLETYGGGTAVADNTAALTAALAVNRCIVLPPGTLNFLSSQSIAVAAGASLTLQGGGKDTTVLHFPAATDGLAITLGSPRSSAHLNGFSIVTAGAGGTTKGVSLVDSSSQSNPANTALSEVNITVRGDDGYAVSNYWKTGIYVNAVSNINFFGTVLVGNAGVTSGSVGVDLEATGQFGVVYNFHGITANYLDKGIVYGQNIQGVTVSQSNFTGGNFGIYYPDPAGTAELVVLGSQFESKIAGIYNSGGVQVTIDGNTFYVGFAGAAYGIHAVSPGGMIVSHNTFINAGSGGFAMIDEADTSPQTIVTENIISSAVGGLPAWWLPSSATAYPAIFSNNSYGASSFSPGPSVTVIQDTPQTFATLLACTSTYSGRTATVTDSSTATFGATITGSGTHNVAARCNGTNWTVTGA